MVSDEAQHVKGLATIDFNGAHWRVTVAGEVAGLWPHEQQAQERADAVEKALRRRDTAFQASALQERTNFLHVIANMQIEQREMAEAMGRLQAAAEAAEGVLDSLVGLGTQANLRPRALAALAALRRAMEVKQ